MISGMIYCSSQPSFGLKGHLLGWFGSYLSGRVQSVRCRNSSPTLILCGVPQGSVLGPILFLLYTADLLRLVESPSSSTPLCRRYTDIWFLCPIWSFPASVEGSCVYRRGVDVDALKWAPTQPSQNRSTLVLLES